MPDDIVTERKILTPEEVARLFKVDPKTVARWADTGKIPVFRTIGGHRRFYEDEVLPFLTPESTLEGGN